MVYYTALPLIMQPEQSSAQICSNPNADIDNSSVVDGINFQVSSHEQQQQQQQQISNLNGILPQEPQQNYNNFHQINSKPIHEHLNLSQQQQQQQPQQHHHQQQQQQQTTKAQFKCEQCNMSFNSKSAHTSHIKSHERNYQHQQMQQQQQQQINGSTIITQQHQQQLHQQQQQQQPDQSLTTNGGIVSANSGNTEPYQCDVCKKTFAVPARLVRHYRTHTGERPFACEFCHKTFSVKENLQVHRRIHTKERPYKCEVCGRAFEHSGKLHRHMRIHTGERPHKCSVCGKTFIQSGQLVIHMRTHTGEKPYKCPVEGCGKGFTCSKQLKVHSRTHTGEKPYHCDICLRDFGYNHVLKLHRVQHYGSKCYKCTICDETFKSKKEMEAHIKGHANDLPDDDDEHSDTNTKMEISELTTLSGNIDEEDPLALTLTMPSTSGIVNTRDSLHVIPETPKESESEANSDGDDVTYYNMYSRFEQSVVHNYGGQQQPSGANVGGGVNPALLAAASIAAAASAANFDEEQHQNRTPSPDTKTNIIMITPNDNDSHHMQPPTTNTITTTTTTTTSQQPEPTFVYEPLSVMRQNGYFAPPQATGFRPSANDLVRRLEAALAGTEPLLTPPRSSPESPDRSSSPESDSILMADRDIMSLPPRKRKLYLKDNQNSSDSSPVMRMSSVIQFAKAS